MFQKDYFGGHLESWRAVGGVCFLQVVMDVILGLVFTPKTVTSDWSLSITTRAANQMTEKITQNDSITTTSVITSLSVFSQ